MPVVAWVLTAVLVPLAIVAVLGSTGVIPKNRWFGIKLPALERSENAWRVGHAAAIPSAVIGSVFALASTIIGLFYPVLNFVTLALFVVTVVVALAIASKAAHAAG